MVASFSSPAKLPVASSTSDEKLGKEAEIENSTSIKLKQSINFFTLVSVATNEYHELTRDHY